MAFETICPPALIYIFFSLTQIVLDSYKGLYNTAFLKLWVALIFTILLNYLCSIGLGVVSWFIVFIPFILMSLIIGMLLLSLGLDPSSGKSIRQNVSIPQNNIVQAPTDYRAEAARMYSNTTNDISSEYDKASNFLSNEFNSITSYIDPSSPPTSSTQPTTTAKATSSTTNNITKKTSNAGHYDNYNDSTANTIVN